MSALRIDDGSQALGSAHVWKLVREPRGSSRADARRVRAVDDVVGETESRLASRSLWTIADALA